jgi:hypothetical protein
MSSLNGDRARTDRKTRRRRLRRSQIQVMRQQTAAKPEQVPEKKETPESNS